MQPNYTVRASSANPEIAVNRDPRRSAQTSAAIARVAASGAAAIFVDWKLADPVAVFSACTAAAAAAAAAWPWLSLR